MQNDNLTEDQALGEFKEEAAQQGLPKALDNLEKKLPSITNKPILESIFNRIKNVFAGNDVTNENLRKKINNALDTHEGVKEETLILAFIGAIHDELYKQDPAKLAEIIKATSDYQKALMLQDSAACNQTSTSDSKQKQSEATAPLITENTHMTITYLFIEKAKELAEKIKQAEQSEATAKTPTKDTAADKTPTKDTAAAKTRPLPHKKSKKDADSAGGSLSNKHRALIAAASLITGGSFGVFSAYKLATNIVIPSFTYFITINILIGLIIASSTAIIISTFTTKTAHKDGYQALPGAITTPPKQPRSSLNPDHQKETNKEILAVAGDTLERKH